MPIFEYECDSCGATKEILIIAGKANEVAFCMGCERAMRRVISATNFKLNGSCWARDGYASSGTYYGDPEGQGRDE